MAYITDNNTIDFVKVFTDLGDAIAKIIGFKMTDAGVNLHAVPTGKFIPGTEQEINGQKAGIPIYVMEMTYNGHKQPFVWDGPNDTDPNVVSLKWRWGGLKYISRIQETMKNPKGSYEAMFVQAIKEDALFFAEQVKFLIAVKTFEQVMFEKYKKMAVVETYDNGYKVYDTEHKVYLGNIEMEAYEAQKYLCDLVFNKQKMDPQRTSVGIGNFKAMVTNINSTHLYKALSENGVIYSPYGETYMSYDEYVECIKGKRSYENSPFQMMNIPQPMSALDDSIDRNKVSSENVEKESETVDSDKKTSLNGNPRTVSCHVDLNGNEYEELEDKDEEETKLIDAEFKSGRVSLNGNPRTVSCHVDLNGNEYEDPEDEDEEEETVCEESDKDVYIGDSDIPLIRYTGSSKIRVVKQSKGW